MDSKGKTKENGIMKPPIKAYFSKALAEATASCEPEKVLGLVVGSVVRHLKNKSQKGDGGASAFIFSDVAVTTNDYKDGYLVDLGLAPFSERAPETLLEFLAAPWPPGAKLRKIEAVGEARPLLRTILVDEYPEGITLEGPIDSGVEEL